MNCYAPFEGNEACISPLLKETGAKSSFSTHLFLGTAGWLLWRYLMGIPGSTVSTKPTCFNAKKTGRATQQSGVSAHIRRVASCNSTGRPLRSEGRQCQFTPRSCVWRVTVQRTITWDPPFTGIYGISSSSNIPWMGICYVPRRVFWLVMPRYTIRIWFFKQQVKWSLLSFTLVCQCKLTWII